MNIVPSSLFSKSGISPPKVSCPTHVYIVAVTGDWVEVICYNATISACEKGGAWQMALMLLGDPTFVMASWYIISMLHTHSLSDASEVT